MDKLFFYTGLQGTTATSQERRIAGQTPAAPG